MKRSIILITIVVIIGFVSFFYSSANSQPNTKNYTVKLYSGGTVVGTWQSFQVGNNDKESITFFIGSQTFPHQVTICGTYSVEQTQ